MRVRMRVLTRMIPYSDESINYNTITILSTFIPGENVMDSAELINNELKCLNRWLNTDKISINANKT